MPFAVVIIEGNCVDTSQCITIEILGRSTEDFVSLSLYPNPTKDIIHLIGFDQLKDLAKIEIKDNLGAFIERIELQKRQIDLSKLAKGVYYLEVTLKNKNRRIKMIKQ